MEKWKIQRVEQRRGPSAKILWRFLLLRSYGGGAIIRGENDPGCCPGRLNPKKKANLNMEIYLIHLAVAMIGGLMLSRLTKLVHLPAVTAYLVAGLLLGPFFLGALKVPGLGFTSLEEVESLKIVT